MVPYRQQVVVVSALVALGMAIGPRAVRAGHEWGYHWSRAANPILLEVGDNVSGAWDPYLNRAVDDWDVGAPGFGFADVLDLDITPGATRPRSCKPVAGRIEVCSSAYGFTGWLGVARIWIDATGHIAQATTQVNDTYFGLSQYNTPATRQFVMCQEIGHDFGLDHQDVDFDNANLGSCMDYTSDPGGTPSNEHPNAHDFETLQAIYNHTDAPSGGGGGGGRNGGGRNGGSVGAPTLLPSMPTQTPGVSPGEWGQLLRANRSTALFELDLGGGHRLLTFVIWS